MNISGDDAKLYDAVRLDSFEAVNRGELVSADDLTGTVVYKDTPDSQKTIVLGERAIKILPKNRFGR